jgi:uncharacterized RDD family membrane protein YckC
MGEPEPIAAAPASAAPPADAGPVAPDTRLEFESVTLARTPAPDPDLDFTLGGTPLGGDVRAGGGALILPGREASGSVSAGFARVRPTPPVEDEPSIAEVDDPEPPTAGRVTTASQPDPIAPVDAEPEGPAAPLGPRMLAGLVDLAVLLAVDAAVVLATLRATGVEITEVQRLPLAPLAVFLVLLAVGYLSLCTVLAGRTFGKAAFGLAVVEAGGRPVRLAPAVVRALIQVVSVPAAGIGFLPALLGADRRSLYDRLAGTDVVRAAANGQDTRAE